MAQISYGLKKDFAGMSEEALPAKIDYPKSIVPKVKKYLGHDGQKFFVEILLKEGDLISTHFREGMQVRNFLRTLQECKKWSPNELDDNWIDIVLEAIEWKGKPTE